MTVSEMSAHDTFRSKRQNRREIYCNFLTKLQ